jgi:hypothetical protein
MRKELLTKEYFEREYIKNKRTLDDLSEEIGLSARTLSKYLNKFGVRKQNGRKITQEGYVKIFSPDHPFKDANQYVYEHRLVMEKKLGRYLTKEEVVHHIDGDKLNNNIENLELFESAQSHKAFHKKIDKENTGWANGFDKCIDCGTTEQKHRGHGLCRRCFGRKEYQDKVKRKVLKEVFRDIEDLQKEKLEYNSMSVYQLVEELRELYALNANQVQNNNYHQAGDVKGEDKGKGVTCQRPISCEDTDYKTPANDFNAVHVQEDKK